MEAGHYWLVVALTLLWMLRWVSVFLILRHDEKFKKDYTKVFGKKSNSKTKQYF